MYPSTTPKGFIFFDIIFLIIIICILIQDFSRSIRQISFCKNIIKIISMKKIITIKTIIIKYIITIKNISIKNTTIKNIINNKNIILNKTLIFIFNSIIFLNTNIIICLNSKIFSILNSIILYHKIINILKHISSTPSFLSRPKGLARKFIRISKIQDLTVFLKYFYIFYLVPPRSPEYKTGSNTQNIFTNFILSLFLIGSKYKTGSNTSNIIAFVLSANTRPGGVCWNIVNNKITNLTISQFEKYNFPCFIFLYNTCMYY